MRHVTKPGRAANSNERGAGQIVHAVLGDHSVFDMRVPALCGAKPSGRLGWSDHETLSPGTPLPEVNCPKCLKRIASGEANKEDWQVVQVWPEFVVETNCNGGGHRRVYPDGRIEHMD